MSVHRKEPIPFLRGPLSHAKSPPPILVRIFRQSTSCCLEYLSRRPLVGSSPIFFPGLTFFPVPCWCTCRNDCLERIASFSLADEDPSESPADRFFTNPTTETFCAPFDPYLRGFEVVPSGNLYALPDVCVPCSGAALHAPVFDRTLRAAFRVKSLGIVSSSMEGACSFFRCPRLRSPFFLGVCSSASTPGRPLVSTSSPQADA